MISVERQAKDGEKILSSKVDLLDFIILITEKTTFQRIFPPSSGF